MLKFLHFVYIAGICGGGSTLSEYDMYFHFARQKFPGTVNLRPLIWANGPKYGNTILAS